MSAAGPDARAALASLDEDLRALIREVAASRFALAEADRERHASERKWLLGLVGIVDAMDRVFRSVEAKPDKVTDQMKVWLGNFRAVARLVERQLADGGARRMPRDGAAFDPERHTILETVEDASREDGAIAEEVRPGWLRGDEVLRKAEVRVVNNGEQGDEWAG